MADIAKPISESKRQIEVFRYYSSQHQLVDLTADLEASPQTPLPPAGHVAQASKDTALIAYAQLGAVKVKADRVLISLIDTNHQYVLAEATASSTLHQNASMTTSKDVLWLGSALLPKTRGICHEVLNLPVVTTSHERTETLPAVVIPDLTQDLKYQTASFVQGSPHLRFFAGVPIISPDGYNIGSYCVLDTKPRDNLSQDLLLELYQLAKVVMSHLHATQLREEHQRTEKMVRGLVSFIEGAKSLDQTSTIGVSVSKSIANLDQVTDALDDQRLPNSSLRSNSRQPSTQRTHTSTAQEMILPSGTKLMFSRAANLLRQTSDLNGVIIFDAVIASHDRSLQSSNTVDSNEETITASAEDSGSSSGDSKKSLITSRNNFYTAMGGLSGSYTPKIRQTTDRCEVLGYANKDAASIEDIYSDLPDSALLTEYVLTKLIKKYPQGGVFNYTFSGEISSTDESAVRNRRSSTRPSIKTVPMRKTKLATALREIAPDARSLAFVPLWDYERARWFAACVCWTVNPLRPISPATDLSFIKAFGNSVMTELSRLDALEASRTKATFASLLSHELRSPLHGILGAVQFLNETKLDSFQENMLSSVDMCGRTLLETIDHMLGHAKINESVQQNNSILSKGKSTTGATNASTSLTSSMDLSVAIEEIVEAVFAGQSYGTLSMRLDDEVMSKNEPDSKPFTTHNIMGNKSVRKLITIVVNIEPRASWVFITQPAAWRRILINLFGNSLKYTSNGYIEITLGVTETHQSSSGELLVVTRIKDTGIGMSKNFMINKLFQPFSQEDSFYAGTGLGLSIVHQLVSSMSGNISVNSEPKVGTEMTITIPLRQSHSSDDSMNKRAEEFAAALHHIEGQKVCIFYKEKAQDPNFLAAEGVPAIELSLRAKSIEDIFRDWFRVETFISHEWVPQSAQIVVSCEPSFDLLEATHQSLFPTEKPPVILFVALDAMEASVLRQDGRVISASSVVEIVTQPCGPHKLANAILHCLKRQQSMLESQNIDFSTDPNSTFPVPKPASPVPRPLSQEYLSRPPILIVDDNALNRKLLKTFLKKNQLPFLEATNGSEALSIFKAYDVRGSIEIILMDLSMPVMDGMTATREIRSFERASRQKKCLIIALTGLASTSTRIEAKESGMDHFMTKPVRFAELKGFLSLDEKA